MTISPAKKLRESGALPTDRFTQPAMLDAAAELVEIMREKDSFEVAELMKLSMPLADLNVARFQAWQLPFTPDNARPALFMFAGDVYQGLDAASLSGAEIDFAQDHLRILSGLYGVLRPLDLMQPYRLEMGTRLANARGGNLYDYWGGRITQALNEALAAQGDDLLVNLASNEYFKAVRCDQLRGRIITPQFKELRNGSYRIVSFNAKRARGLMCRFIIRHRITRPDDLLAFDLDRYRYNPALSEPDRPVFTR